MKLNDVCSIFLNGDYAETVLFKCALYWAEFGEPVWFISSKPFTSLPNGWTKPADKEVLKLIYFIYIPETEYFISKLCDIHLIPKVPKVIIVMDMDHYIFSNNTNTDFTNMSFVTACLLDAAKVYQTKINSPSFLISSCKIVNNQKLQTILDLYYSYNFQVSDNTFIEIENIFKNVDIKV